MYQSRYALLRALADGKTNPGLSVSIEKFDDVAFEDNSNATELIQTKHHSSPGDTTDKSVDIWKTLNIWISFVKADPAGAADTRFVFLTTHTAATESALSRLRPHQESRDIDEAIALLSKAALDSENRTTAKARQSFLDLDGSLAKLLVENIWVFDQSPDISGVRSEIEDALYYAAPEGKIEQFVDYIEGWWFSRVISALSGNNNDSIPVYAIQSKISEVRESFQSGKLPLDDEIDAMPVSGALPDDSRVMVRQMQIIQASEEAAIAAVHDYYRASAQRSRWARENLLLDGEAERYDRSLEDAWRRKHIAACEDSGADQAVQIQQGRHLLRWACSFPKPLRNRDELWLSSGSFQILADALRVGWHPNYQDLIKVDGGPDS